MKKVYSASCKDCGKEIKTITNPEGQALYCGCEPFVKKERFEMFHLARVSELLVDGREICYPVSMYVPLHQGLELLDFMNELKKEFPRLKLKYFRGQEADDHGYWRKVRTNVNIVEKN